MARKKARIREDILLNNERDNIHPRAFTRRTANQVMQDAASQPIPNMLFDHFIYEHEITCIYTKPNVGKSLVAMHIAQSIASGEPIGSMKLEAKPQPVIYFDFELSDFQFRARYATEYTNLQGKRNYMDDYEFNSNLHICKFTGVKVPRGLSVSEFYFKQIILESEETGAKIIFIDNISWMTMKGLETSENAKELVGYFVDLARNHGYSLIIIAHTPKVTEQRPLYLTDLAGSATLGNFIDAAFIVNESYPLGKKNKYLKMVKARSCPIVYDRTNLVNIILDYISPNFLGITIADVPEEYKNESNHFIRNSFQEGTRNNDSHREAKMSALAKLLAEKPEVTFTEITNAIGISRSTAHTYKEKLLNDPQLFDGFMKPIKNDRDEAPDL